jgi:hypothetical protein
MCEVLEKYETNLQSYVNSMWGPYIFFEITKCCGYSQFIPTYRDGTLKDLYRSISSHFGFRVNGLFAKNGEDLLAVQNENTSLKDFIRLNPDFFKPIYPLPAKVVYNIYFVGGCCGYSAPPAGAFVVAEPVV